MRILRRVPQCQLIAAGVIFGECRARLHRVRHQPIVDDIELGDVLGRFECGFSAFRIADVPLIDGVVRRDFVDLRGARLLRRGQVGDRRQYGVVDLELFGGVARLRQRFRDDNRDRIADVAGFAVSERRMRRHFHRRAVFGMNHPAADEIADLVGGELRAGQHRDHAWRGGRRLAVDRFDGRVGVRGTDEEGVSLAGPVDVVRVVALAGDEAVVLLAAHCGADPGRTHGSLLRLFFVLVT